MLTELQIRDFKLLRNVTIKFGRGMTALTGETGAGKTQCLEALIAALGARFGEDAISKDASRAEITAIFNLSDREDVLKELRNEGWIDDDESDVVLERTIEREGSSRGWLNGRRVPLGTLQSVAERLVDILGQNARADILKRPSIEILDSLGDKSHLELIEKVRNSFRRWKEARELLEREREQVERIKERKELAHYQYSELKKAGLVSGEEDKLTQELELLSNTKDRIERSEKASELLDASDDTNRCARDFLIQALNELEILSQKDSSLEGEFSRLRDIIYISEEIASNLRRYSKRIVDDPERRAYIEERLRIIHSLKHKYKKDEAGLIELRDSLESELMQVETADERLEELSKSIEAILIEYKENAQRLSESRHKLAKRISKEVMEQLKDLDLGGGVFEVDFREVGDEEGKYRADGIDQVEFMISTNASQPLGPMKKVASGGELSRLLIALKSVLANHDRVPVLVFDEAEAGIGGETAFKVGEKLAKLARSHQLILVSHLPQIASQADFHWVIEKSTEKNGTEARARIVNGKSRVEEISRMLGARGDKASLEKLAESFLRQ